MDLKSAVAQVKDAYDIVDFFRTEGLELTTAGVGRWKALCPMPGHNEKTPSFNIMESFQRYKCFGCGASGDLITYVQERENLSFMETIKKLAQDKGIELELEERSGESTVDYASLQNLMRAAANFYCKQFDRLPEDHIARLEITKRGLTFDNSSPESIKYGYSPAGNQLLAAMKKLGFTEELMVQAGLVRERNGRYFDFFRSRLMFIFTDRYGKPIGFTSRKLLDDDKMGKYVNSPEGPLFRKHSVLYNHAVARRAAGKAKRVFVSEGQFDVAAIYESGIQEVVAASGTAFTRDHAQECLKMAGAEGHVIFCFDGDAAGIKAAMKVFVNAPEVHERGVVVQMPEGQDPCDYRLEHGAEALVAYLQDHGIPLAEFILRQVKQRYDMTSPVDRANFVAQGAQVVKVINNATLRSAMLNYLSLESLTPLDTVLQAVEEATPLALAPDQRPQEEDHTREELLQEEAPPEEELTLELLRERLQEDPKLAVGVRFLSLAFERRAWRASALRARDLLPAILQPLMDELETLRDREKLFPEHFKNDVLARFVMEEELSAFYKLMGGDELREHFIYLHGRLQELQHQEAQEEREAQIMGLLHANPQASASYLEGVLKKMDA